MERSCLGPTETVDMEIGAEMSPNLVRTLSGLPFGGLPEPQPLFEAPGRLTMEAHLRRSLRTY